MGSFPVVPFVPGVPPLPVNPFGSPLAALTLLTSDLISFAFGLSGAQWGIYLTGIPVVVADSVVDITYKQDWSISDYPVEQGAFESYDKVQIPFEIRIRFSAGGSEVDRQNLLSSIAAVAGDLNLYTVVTPEQTYPSVNITHYDYKRTAINGVGLLVVDVWLKQIRVSVASPFTNTQSASSTAQTNDGTVQTQTPPANAQSDVSPASGFGGLQ